MSKITQSDADYIMKCVRDIRAMDAHGDIAFPGGWSDTPDAVQSRLELFVTGIAVLPAEASHD